jgi:hypothetical protein
MYVFARQLIDLDLDLDLVLELAVPLPRRARWWGEDFAEVSPKSSTYPAA